MQSLNEKQKRVWMSGPNCQCAIPSKTSSLCGHWQLPELSFHMEKADVDPPSDPAEIQQRVFSCVDHECYYRHSSLFKE